MEQHHYCIHFPSGLCRAKVLPLLKLLIFCSKTCWAMRAQGGLKWQRLPWPPKMFGTVQSSQSRGSGLCVCTWQMKGSKRLFVAGCWTDLEELRSELPKHTYVAKSEVSQVLWQRSFKSPSDSPSPEFLYSSHHLLPPAHFSLSFTGLSKGTTSFQELWCFIWFWDPEEGMVHCSHSHQLFCIPRVKHSVSCFPDWRLGRKNTTQMFYCEKNRPVALKPVLYLHLNACTWYWNTHYREIWIKCICLFSLAGNLEPSQ